MLSEENAKLTQVGPGTPMGNLLRRYWHPIAAAAELDEDPVRRVRLLGEDLVLFRTAAGELGLVGSRCLHRGMSLAYGVPQENGLRCCYHGWTYNTDGVVVDMPFEANCLGLKIAAYRAVDLGGAVFAYLGPAPAPLLPKHELFVRADLKRNIEITELPCNWLQCMDNSLDPIHVEHLHGVYGAYVRKKSGKAPGFAPARHLKIDFDVFEYGIMKRRLLEGESEESDDWRIGHPVIFPHILYVAEATRPHYQIRVPVDDTHTLNFRYQGLLPKAGESVPAEIPARRERPFDEQGNLVCAADNVPEQDMIAWVGQGPVADRSREHLMSSDRGVALYRTLLEENITRVERGEDPMGVIRDHAKNEPMIQVVRPHERPKAFYIFDGKFEQPSRPSHRG
ncbi:MAG TPA: Rieske 2Fe-2S domain-containing protein [Candidatus Binatia bacterium]|jgi:5,5'-dehydrodivanillate O-demethylase